MTLEWDFTTPTYRSSLFWDVTQGRLVVTNVSVQPIGPIFKDQAVQEGLLGLPDPACPETSVTKYQSALRNIPEERRSRLHRGGSLKLRNRL